MKMLRDKKGLAPAVAVSILIVITVAVVAGIGYVVSSISSMPVETPKGVFSVEISKTGAMGYGYMHMREISGDPIKTGDLKIVFEAKGVRTEVVPGQTYAFYGYGVRGSVENKTDTSQTINVKCIFEYQGSKNITMSNILVRIYNETAGTLLKEGYTDVEGKLTWTGPAEDFASNTSYNVTLVGVDTNGELKDTTAGYSFTITSGNNSRVMDVVVVVESGTYGYYYGVPWKHVPGEFPSSHPEHWFGNYSFTPG
ncbi:hypothetical protein DRO30_01965, partial [Candidatus Bathyarchaeota archaeon]